MATQPITNGNQGNLQSTGQYTEHSERVSIHPNEIIHTFLTHRGLSPEDIDYLVNPNPTHAHNPFLLRGIEEWIGVLHALKGEVFAIAPDYDADGVLSGTVARVGLYLFGFGDAYVYPPKTRDGYGLTRKTVDNILKAQPDTRVIITTDNGSNAHDGIAYAKRKGLFVLVTDHHLADSNPLADAHVNPNQRGQETYPFREISGTTVIYKALLAYAHKYHHDVQALREFHSLILMVGISTISDVMPLLDENRYFVTQAVKMLEHFEQGHSLERVLQYDDTPIGQFYRGVDLLVGTLHKHKKLKYGINSDTFGFTIGPMLNSPRRMVGESELAFDLFQTEKASLLNGTTASPSDALYELNEERKAYVKRLTKALYKKIDTQSGVEPIYFSAFNLITGAGIAGLLANSFTQKYGYPSIAFAVPESVPESAVDTTRMTDDVDLINVDVKNAKGHISGSGRAPDGFDLHAFLTVIDNEYPDLIHKWGGHAQAAGITIKAENFERFRMVYVEKLIQILTQEQEEQSGYTPSGQREVQLPIHGEYVLTTNTYEGLARYYPKPEHVVEIQASDAIPIMANESLLESVRFFEQLEPFGNGFPKPTFSLVFRMNEVDTFFMGAEKQHVKVTLSNGLSAIYWNGAEALTNDAPEIEVVDPVTGFVRKEKPKDMRIFAVTGTLGINEFNGRESLQVIIKDIEEVAF